MNKSKTDEERLSIIMEALDMAVAPVALALAQALNHDLDMTVEPELEEHARDLLRKAQELVRECDAWGRGP